MSKQERLIKQAISHFKYMVSFAKERDPKEIADSGVMELCIGESWRSVHCPLCIEYADVACKGCPIHEYTNEKNCRGTPWGRVNSSVTWSDWIEHAESEISMLEDILIYYTRSEYAYV